MNVYAKKGKIKPKLNMQLALAMSHLTVVFKVTGSQIAVGLIWLTMIS